MKKTRSMLHLLGMVWLLPAGLVLAATEGRIYAPHEVDPAATGTLSGELSVFESVAQGIALSLAACEGRSDCSPALSEDELSQLIRTLDQRIEQLNTYDAQADTGAEYDSLLNNYRQTRDSYALYLRELQDVRQNIREFAEEDAIKEPVAEKPAPEPEKAARAEPPKPKFRNEAYSIEIFEDVDELIRSE